MGQGSTNAKLQCQISSWISMEQLQSAPTSRLLQGKLLESSCSPPTGLSACILKMCAASEIAEYNSNRCENTGVQLSQASPEHLPVPVCALAKIKYHVDSQSRRLFQPTLYRPVPIAGHAVRRIPPPFAVLWKAG